MLTIDKIEGNSGIGVPVFSKAALVLNYDFDVLRSQKQTVKSIPEP